MKINTKWLLKFSHTPKMIDSRDSLSGMLEMLIFSYHILKFWNKVFFFFAVLNNSMSFILDEFFYDRDVNVSESKVVNSNYFSFSSLSLIFIFLYLLFWNWEIGCSVMSHVTWCGHNHSHTTTYHEEP